MVAKLSSDVAHYYHQDALGSVRLVTNPAVEITFGSNYVPFGTTVNTTGAEAFMYTGKPVDDITGLYYFGARFYDPSIHRFIAQDRNAGQIGDPISMNRYIYARDNPLAFKDPDGNNPVPVASMPSSQMQAWIVVACAWALVGLLLVACPITGGGAILAEKAAINAAISVTIYTLSEGEKATAEGAVVTAVCGGISGLAPGVPNLGTTVSKVAQKTAQVAISTFSNTVNDVALDCMRGDEISINPISTLASVVNPMINIPDPLIKQEATALYALESEFVNTFLLTSDNLIEPYIITPQIDEDWANIYIYF